MDLLPPIATVAAGLLLAAGGAGLLAVAPVGGAMAFVALLAVALGLAFSAEPVAVPLEPRADEERKAREDRVASDQAPTTTPAPSRSDSDPDEPLLAWVHIPAFHLMIESDSWEYAQPSREVTLSAFDCMNVPVTRRLYKAVMGKDPSPWPGEADTRPVTRVTWDDAIEFCNRWSERRGLSPCYQLLRGSVTLAQKANGYRLLTEAEWESAASAGRTTPAFLGGEAQAGDYASGSSNSADEIRPVGQENPNALGLYDMRGTPLWEWVADWYGGYPSVAQPDPASANAGGFRVVRGVALNFGPRGLRSEGGVRSVPEGRLKNSGFRCARAPAAEIEP